MKHNDRFSAFNDEMIQLLDQSMIKIRHCLSQLNDEQVWWRPAKDINCIGNLLLHLAGNLRQWVVAGVGGQTDDRQRQKEFDQRDLIPAGELAQQIESTVDEAKEIIAAQNSADLFTNVVIQGFETTKFSAIVHTTSHFVGHTHQIIMLARMQLGDKYEFQWSPDDDKTQVPI